MTAEAARGRGISTRGSNKSDQPNDIANQHQHAAGRLLTRNGNNWSELFPTVAAAVSLLKVRSCLIDGEVVVCDEHGLAVFDLLRRGNRVKHEAHLIAFDLIELDGRDLRREPLEERKRRLADLLNRAKHPGLQLSEHVDSPATSRPRLRARLRGDRFEAQGLALSIGAAQVHGLDQGEESGGAGGTA
jgi:hypothetical protein